MKITKSCGCVRRKVAVGTIYEGWLDSFCDRHNPYRNVAPRIEL